MSWIPFADELDTLGAIYSQLINFPQYTQDLMMGFVYTIVYPFVLAIEYFAFDVNYSWLILATFVNAVIGIPNFFISLLNVIMPTEIPIPIIILVYVQIFIQVIIRSLGWIRFIWKNIPIIGGH